MTASLSSRISRAALPAGPSPPMLGIRNPTLIVSAVTPWSDAVRSIGAALAPLLPPVAAGAVALPPVAVDPPVAPPVGVAVPADAPDDAAPVDPAGASAEPL